jgi:nitroreductase
MIISELIRSRRSVYPFQYTGEKVSDNIILEALENANHAPNHGKTEPWRFIVFKEKALNELAEFQANHYKRVTEQGLFKDDKYQKFFDKAGLTSHVIAIVHHRKEPNKIPVNEELEAIGCAVQNIHLTISASGNGGYWSTGGGVYTKELDQYLGLDENENCVGLFFVGVPKTEPRPINRGPIEEKIRWA